MNTDNT